MRNVPGLENGQLHIGKIGHCRGHAASRRGCIGELIHLGRAPGRAVFARDIEVAVAVKVVGMPTVAVDRAVSVVVAAAPAGASAAGNRHSRIGE